MSILQSVVIRWHYNMITWWSWNMLQILIAWPGMVERSEQSLVHQRVVLVVLWPRLGALLQTLLHTLQTHPRQHSSSVLTVWNSFARNQAQIVLLSADSECEYQLQCWYYGEISVSGTSSLSTSSSSSSSSSLSMSVSTSFMNSNFEIDYVYSDCKNPQLSFNETVQSYQIIVIFHTRQKTVFVSTPTTTHIKLIKVRKQLFIMETFLNQEGHLDEKFWKRIKC